MPLSTRCLGTGLALLLAGASALFAQEAIRPANWPAPPLWSGPAASRGAPEERSLVAARAEVAQTATAPLPFVAIDPCRMLDTRTLGGSIGSGLTRDVVLTGAPCGIPANAAAVSANFVVFNILGAPGNGVLKIWPTGSPSTSQALLNWSPTAGQLDNASVVALGAGGSITLQPNQGAGTIDMVIDVNGYYAGTVVTSVTPGAGLTGGGSGAVSLGIAAGGVTATELASNAVTSSKIAANAVTSGAIAAGAVTDAHLAGSISLTKLAAGVGGILYGDGAGIVSQNINLWWDSTNHRLGLGTATPGQQLELTGMMKMPATGATAGAPTAGVLFLGSHAFLHDYTSSANRGNTFVGEDVGNFTNSSFNNTAVGAQAMRSIAGGTDNTAVGVTSLFSNAGGGKNAAVGYAAMYSNTQGSSNTAMGWLALNNNTTADGNVAIGDEALYTQAFSNSNTEWYSNNTAVGYGALYSNHPTSTGNGVLNTALGMSSLLGNETGSLNTAAGAYALQSNSSGFQNTALGYNAGNRSGASTGYGGGAITYVPITTGNYNTFVGEGTGATASDVFNCTAVGIDAYCDAGNQVRLGNIYVTSIGGKVGWSALSDARAKTDTQDLALGLDFVRKLRPVAYKLKGGNDRTDMGFLAQDIEALLGDRYNVLTVGGDTDRTLSLRYTDLIAPLVKAIQEQQRIIEDLTARLRRLEAHPAEPAAPAPVRPPY